MNLKNISIISAAIFIINCGMPSKYKMDQELSLTDGLSSHSDKDPKGGDNQDDDDDDSEKKSIQLKNEAQDEKDERSLELSNIDDLIGLKNSDKTDFEIKKLAIRIANTIDINDNNDINDNDNDINDDDINDNDINDDDINDDDKEDSSNIFDYNDKFEHLSGLLGTNPSGDTISRNINNSGESAPNRTSGSIIVAPDGAFIHDAPNIDHEAINSKCYRRLLRHLITYYNKNKRSISFEFNKFKKNKEDEFKFAINVLANLVKSIISYYSLSNTSISIKCYNDGNGDICNNTKQQYYLNTASISASVVAIACTVIWSLHKCKLWLKKSKKQRDEYIRKLIFTVILNFIGFAGDAYGISTSAISIECYNNGNHNICNNINKQYEINTSSMIISIALIVWEIILAVYGCTEWVKNGSRPILQ